MKSLSNIRSVWILPIVIISAVVLLLANSNVHAANQNEEYDINCKITDVESLVDFGARSSKTNASKARNELAAWMFGDEHSITVLPVMILWRKDAEGRSRLSLLLDGQQEKTARILSQTNDTVAAVHMASDRSTTRSWLFSLNFKQELVMATMNESNLSGARGMALKLDCDYKIPKLPSGTEDNAG